MNQLREGKLFIDGEWRAASDGATFDVINPADESLVGLAADATAADVSDGVRAARTAFDTTIWPPPPSASGSPAAPRSASARSCSSSAASPRTS